MAGGVSVLINKAEDSTSQENVSVGSRLGGNARLPAEPEVASPDAVVNLRFNSTWAPDASLSFFLTSMATTSESTVVRLSTTSPQDWKYVSEGGATIVFSYTGSPNPEFDGMVLRLRKTTALPQSNDSSDSEINRAIQYALQGHVHQAVEELDDPMIEFQHTIMERLIPPEHLPRLAPVQVERAWLQDLANKSDPERPEERRRKDRIDILKTKAVIATDLVGGDGLAVEIKVSCNVAHFCSMH